MNKRILGLPYIPPHKNNEKIEYPYKYHHLYLSSCHHIYVYTGKQGSV